MGKSPAGVDIFGQCEYIKELGAVKAEKLKKLKRMKLLYVEMELHGIII